MEESRNRLVASLAEEEVAVMEGVKWMAVVAVAAVAVAEEVAEVVAEVVVTRLVARAVAVAVEAMPAPQRKPPGGNN